MGLMYTQACKLSSLSTYFPEMHNYRRQPEGCKNSSQVSVSDLPHQIICAVSL